MRWESQQVDRERERRLPRLDADAVVRTFGAPEALDIRFHEVHAKSALNAVPKRSGWRSASPATTSFGMNVSWTLENSSKPVISVFSMPARSSSPSTVFSSIVMPAAAAPNSAGSGSRL